MKITACLRLLRIPVLLLAVCIVAGTLRPAFAATTGSAIAVGNNSDGQLGNATANYSSEQKPVTMGGLAGGVELLAAGGNRSLALAADGTVWQWGAGTRSAWDDPVQVDGRTPVLVSGLGGVTALACSSLRSLALKADGTVWSWGSYSGGFTVTQVQGLSNITAISCGSFHDLALDGNGTVWAWGTNTNGQLGDGTTTNRSTPAAVPNLSGVTSIRAGGRHSLALKSDGSVWVWGSNLYGEHGVGYQPNRILLEQVTQVSNVVGIGAGDGFSVVLKADGTVWSWGDINSGNYSYLPEQVAGLSGIASLVTGGKHSHAFQADGTIWGWGYNTYGGIGNGSTSGQIVRPTKIQALSGATALAPGDSHTLAKMPFQMPPLANNDNVSVLRNSSNNGLDPLANDIANGAGLRISAVTQPQHGSVSILHNELGVSYTPATDYGGTDSFTYALSNAYGTATATVNLLVNTPPTISEIADRAIGQDTNTGAISFTVGDLESLNKLTFSASTYDIINFTEEPLVPAGNIVFGGSGANRAMTITPGAGKYGKTEVTVTVSDGHLTASTTFVLDIYRAPRIDSVSPGSATVGYNITLSGYFDRPSSTITEWPITVKFNGVTAPAWYASTGWIMVDVPPGATSGHITVTTPGGTATSPNIFTVIPSYAVSGRISDSQGNGIGGVTILATTDSGTLVGNNFSNSAGYFTLRNVPIGTHTLTAQKSGYSFTPTSRRFTLSNANIGNQNFVGKTGINLAGRISTSTGAAIGGVTLTRTGAGAAPVTTNSAGYFTFIGVQPGSVTITPAKAGHRFVPEFKVMTAGSTDISGVNFIGATGYTLSGRIANSSGVGQANISVRRSGSNLAAVTNSAGYYTFIDVPNGTHTVTATGTGLSFAPEQRTVTINGADVSGQNFIVAPGFSIAGRIMTSSGAAIANVTVTRSGSSQSVVTNSSGYYLFNAVPNGIWMVTPQLNGYTFTPATKSVAVNGANMSNQNFIGRTP